MSSFESKLPINIGFVGLSSKGWGSISHYPALSHSSLHSSFNITAIHTSSKASAQAAAEAYGCTAVDASSQASDISTYYGPDASQIARDPAVDVVAICVKVPDHKPFIEAAIAAGKHYFVEYPPARNLEETLELHRKTEEKGLIGFVGLQGRQSAAIRQVKTIIDSGRIGKILSTSVIALVPREAMFFQPEVLSTNAYTMDPSNGVTMLRIPIAHQLDTLMYLLGSFTSVSARSSAQYPITTVIPSSPSSLPQTIPSLSQDHYAITGHLSSGAHASILWRSGYTSTPGRTQFLWLIDGETGSIKMHSDVGASSTQMPGCFTSITDPTIEVNAKPIGEYVRDEGIGGDDSEDLEDVVVEQAEKGTHVEFIRRAWVEFGKRLTRGEGKTLKVEGDKGEFTTMLDAIKLLRVLDAIEESAEMGGKEVKPQIE